LAKGCNKKGNSITESKRSLLFRAVFHKSQLGVVPSGGANSRTPSHYVDAKSLRGVPKSPNNVTNTIFSTVYLLLKDLFRTRGRQNCFLPRAPSNLFTPLVVPQDFYWWWG